MFSESTIIILNTGLQLVATGALTFSVWEQNKIQREATRIRKIERSHEVLVKFQEKDYVAFAQSILNGEKEIRIPEKLLCKVDGAKLVENKTEDLRLALKVGTPRGDGSLKQKLMYDSIDDFVAFFQSVNEEIQSNSVDEAVLKEALNPWLESANDKDILVFAKDRGYDGLEELYRRWK